MNAYSRMSSNYIIISGENELNVPLMPKETDKPLLHSELDTFTETQENNNNSSLKYDRKSHSYMLCKHILTRGLMEGIGSDIQVMVPIWNKTYRLHRLVLDQNPYFKTLLQGDFQEADSNKITLHLEKDLSFITMDSFQFILEYLYGKIEEPKITTSSVKQVLASCSYFQLADICELCVEFILRHLDQHNAIDYLLFTDEYLVQGSDRITDAILTFLCREAYSMDKSFLISLPLAYLKKIVESDAFWVPSEYDRYTFIKDIIKARYDVYINSKSTNFILTELDTSSYCDIITNSIYYTHMTFEQLESIEKDIHPLTKQRLVPDAILREALWSQVQLRTIVEKTLETNKTLDITTTKSSKNYLIPTDDKTAYTEQSSSSLNTNETSCSQYSMYPPFRFSVEFSDVGSLKYGIRVYSNIVFYAGSNWNVYIQKTRSARKGALQLGVYLHRQSVSYPHESFSSYSDRRKTVKTWFKIYCLTRKHTQSFFQSSPDKFSVLQSWGWRSTALCIDECSNDHTIRFTIVMGHV